MPTPAPSEPSGKDLARQALADYKAHTWAIPGTRPTKPKAVKTRQAGTSRDPVTLGSAFTDLIPDFAAGINGGHIMERWTELCPQYTGTVQPVGYDVQRGRLDLRPSSHSYAAQLRLLGGQLAKQINDKLGKPAVKSVRILAPGNIDTATAPAAGPAAEPAGEVKTREIAHPGYRDSLAAVFANRPDRAPTDPYLVEALARQEAALRARRPQDDAEKSESSDEAAARHARSEASRRAALAFKRGEQKNGPVILPRALDIA